MPDAPAPLILDFLEWLAAGPKAYPDVMEAWRTSCPRLTVWEDAIDHGFVVQQRAGRDLMVALTPLGQGFLAVNNRCGTPVR